MDLSTDYLVGSEYLRAQIIYFASTAWRSRKWQCSLQKYVWACLKYHILIQRFKIQPLVRRMPNRCHSHVAHSPWCYMTGRVVVHLVVYGEYSCSNTCDVFKLRLVWIREVLSSQVNACWNMDIKYHNCTIDCKLFPLSFILCYAMKPNSNVLCLMEQISYSLFMTKM